MKIVCLAVMTAVMLSGCSLFGGSDSACEVFSPAAVTLPTTNNEKQVQTSATGDPGPNSNIQQDCGSKG
ncbi:hypothetical protein [Pseudomonas sp. dw_358]|uniref:hypothetical protein n=1 Tax=Pseudomonas sp. dw_358 TaxID=2720083 RepID=UPI001BD3B33F|nr:hypothetical protein [Pseudomonas sp. dw_358]